ncbi:aromatic ring-hydroxylating dioxygenase subunit alpha, partial [Arthrobacter sp. C9C5]|nr:aromatic ring-hydroxylating dioxygenase subunit alpha [Arthrobacter sp. C9C5]
MTAMMQSVNSTTNKVLGYPLNAWYVAAWDHEVTRKPMSRRIAD